MKKPTFSIAQLDHIAIRVKDLERSAQWYEEVLGLQRVQPEEWKPWPIFMLAGQSGIAIFPAKEGENPMPDHYAFRVSQSDFALAKEHLTKEGISFTFQDHLYFHSIYFKDPDAHLVELTTERKPFPAK